jgi:hypothetical protein
MHDSAEAICVILLIAGNPTENFKLPENIQRATSMHLLGWDPDLRVLSNCSLPCIPVLKPLQIRAEVS